MPERPWILFDIGGVLELVDDDTWPQQWWDRWRRHAGLSAEEFEARLAVADLPPIDIETGTGERFWGAVGRMLGIDTDDVAVMRADFWDAYCGTGNAELFAYIETLPARANLAILSNSVDGARGGGATLRPLAPVRPDLLQPRAGREQAGPAGIPACAGAVERSP